MLKQIGIYFFNFAICVQLYCLKRFLCRVAGFSAGEKARENVAESVCYRESGLDHRHDFFLFSIGFGCCEVYVLVTAERTPLDDSTLGILGFIFFFEKD